MFIDRVVLFVDGREIRPRSAEYIPPRPPNATAGNQSGADNREATATAPSARAGAALHGASSVEELPLGTYRLRGRMPLDAKTLRWYYGLVLDAYVLTVRRADGRTMTETVAGDAWSSTIDISNQFSATHLDLWLWVLIGVFVLGLGLRVRGRFRSGVM
jgi:hypothetical protein